MVCGTKCPGCVSRWLHLGQALFQWSEGPFNIRDWRWDQWHFQNFLYPTFYSAVLRDFGMLGPQVFCLVMSVNELLQDLGALFLLYTSVGDAEGVLNTGKLAEAGAVMANDAFFLQLFNVLVFFFLYDCLSSSRGQESNIGNIAVLCYLLLGETKRALQAQQSCKLLSHFLAYCCFVPCCLGNMLLSGAHQRQSFAWSSCLSD